MPVSNEPFEGLGVSYMLTDHAAESHLQMREYEQLAERIARDGRKRVLDWGCGFGHLSSMIETHGIGVTLYDYVPDLGDDLYRSLSRYPHLRACLSSDPVKLPYADASFDAVISMGTLEHVSDPISSLSEIRRVLDTGALFYVFKLPNRWSYVEALARRTGRYHHGALPNDRVYTYASARDLLEANGFHILEERYWNMLPLMTLGRRVSVSRAGWLRRANAALSMAPILRRLATNIELIATRRG